MEEEEEVWNDINLLSVNNHRSSAVKGYRLQDFLSKPFTDTPTSGSSPGYEPQPSMLLNLNLNSGLDELGFMTEGRSSNVNVPFDRVLGSVNSSSELLKHSIGGKRMLPATERTDGDRRHKRMIKNRESAARSRARKQVDSVDLVSCLFFDQVNTSCLGKMLTILTLF
ncbi:hypothetical protein R6Q59_019971 [Mikania micrantha]